MIKMQAEKGHGGLSVAGRPYQPDNSGVIKVDPEHVNEAQAHGFKIIGEDTSNGDLNGDKVRAPLEKKRIGDLRIDFATRFKVEADEDMEKPDIIKALVEGWPALKMPQLRKAYEVRFHAEPDKSLKKDDLVEALEAPQE